VRFSLVSAALVVFALVPAAQASDAVDTRITFSIADDDIQRGPQQSATGSPSLPNSIPTAEANVQPAQMHEKRDAGFENLTHFVLYMHKPGFFENVDTEAALVARYEWLQNRGVVLTEDGSYLKLTRAIDDAKLRIVAFPLNSDRFRLGYSYNITWGGGRMFTSTTDRSATPALKVEFERPGMYAFLGLKTALRQMDQDDGTKELDTVYGVLGGAGVDVADELRLEGGAGFFNRGTIDKLELRTVENGVYNTAPWQGFGASAQITYHVGIPIGQPVDFKLYRNDPMQPDNFFKQEKYDDQLSFLVQSEISAVGQTLQDAVKANSTTIQWGVAGDLTGRVKFDKWRLNALLVYRDLAFILYNVPSNPNFMTFPEGVTVQPDVYGAVGADYYLEDLHLTPGVLMGIERPANTVATNTVADNATSQNSQQTLVFHSESSVDILNPGDKVGSVFWIKGTAKMDFSEGMSAVGELSYASDPNRRRLDQGVDGVPVRVPQGKNIVGFNLLLQARF